MQHEDDHREGGPETGAATHQQAGANGNGSLSDANEMSGGDAGSENDAVKMRQAAGAKMAAAAFGEVTALLMRSPGHKHYSLADLEWLILPAVLSNQFALAGAKAKTNTAMTVPVGVALWARVSEDVDKEIAANLNRPLRLRPDQWSSGDILWLIDVVASAEVGRALIGQLSRTVFAGKSFKMRVADADGNRTVRTLQGAAPGDSENAAPQDDQLADGDLP